MTAPDLWTLPTAGEWEGRRYAIHSDYRDVLTVIAWLTGAQGGELLPEERWYTAMYLFYRDFAAMPRRDWQAASDFLAMFLAGGRPQPEQPGPKLLDWQQDAALIAAGVNRVAGRDVRTLPYLHWWSFLACFDAIGEGTLATVVSIRDKLRRGRRLEGWELEFYRAHRAEVDLRPALTGEEAAARAELQALLA